VVTWESRLSSKEDEGTSSLYSNELGDEEIDGDVDNNNDDDKKGHSCFVGFGNVLLKLSNMEEFIGSLLGSSMMLGLDKYFPQVWWP
jgi:hypothetical protein